MSEQPETPDSQSSPPSFVDAIARASKADAEGKPYLGDIPAVESILRLAVASVWPNPEKPESPRATTERLRKTAFALADTFLGKTDEAVPLRNWNEPGSIDKCLAEWCATDDPTPEGRVAGAFIELVMDLMKLADYAGTPGVTKDMWDFQVDGTFQHYAMLFIGISPATQITMEMEPNPESNFGLDPADCDE